MTDNTPNNQADNGSNAFAPQTDEPTTSSPQSEEALKEAIASLTEENHRILSEMQQLRALYEQNFNRQPVQSNERDEFDEVCQKILKGER